MVRGNALQIKETFYKYRDKYEALFDPVECPWCGERCITYKVKRWLNTSFFARLGYTYHEHVCPNCENKLRLKKNLTTKIVFAFLIIAATVDFVLSMLRVPFMDNFKSKSGVDQIMGALALMTLIFDLAYAVPSAKVLKKEKKKKSKQATINKEG